METWLREILRCPSCQGEFDDGQGPQGQPELVCRGCGLAYRIDNSIPVLLIDEARQSVSQPTESK